MLDKLKTEKSWKSRPFLLNKKLYVTIYVCVKNTIIITSSYLTISNNQVIAACCIICIIINLPFNPTQNTEVSMLFFSRCSFSNHDQTLLRNAFVPMTCLSCSAPLFVSFRDCGRFFFFCFFFAPFDRFSDESSSDVLSQKIPTSRGHGLDFATLVLAMSPTHVDATTPTVRNFFRDDSIFLNRCGCFDDASSFRESASIVRNGVPPSFAWSLILECGVAANRQSILASFFFRGDLRASISFSWWAISGMSVCRFRRGFFRDAFLASSLTTSSSVCVSFDCDLGRSKFIIEYLKFIIIFNIERRCTSFLQCINRRFQLRILRTITARSVMGMNLLRYSLAVRGIVHQSVSRDAPA